MAVAKSQRKEKACKNGTKENPRTKVRTSGETNSPSGQPNLHRAGSGGGDKHIKRRAKTGPLLLGQPALMLSGVISLQIFRPSSSMFPTTRATTSLRKPAKVGDRHTMPARTLSVGGIPSRAVGLPGVMLAIFGVIPAGRLGPNPYHSFLKVTNIPMDQTSTPLLQNIWSVASYQFVLKPLTNSHNQDPAPMYTTSLHPTYY